MFDGFLKQLGLLKSIKKFPIYVSATKHTIGQMRTLMGTLFEAIEAEKSFAIASASIGNAFGDGMGIAESRFGDRFYRRLMGIDGGSTQPTRTHLN